MTNYSVPFDFDGKNFLWVEFDKENYRNICIHNIETKITIKHKINKEFGHISFCKIINSSKILLVRLQNIIEIEMLIRNMRFEEASVNKWVFHDSSWDNLLDGPVFI